MENDGDKKKKMYRKKIRSVRKTGRSSLLDDEVFSMVPCDDLVG